MAVYKRTYKVYEGALTPSRSRFLVLTRYALSTLFESRIFTGFAVLCLVPFLISLVYIYLAHSQIARTMLGVRVSQMIQVSNMWFATVLRVQTGFGFILAAWAAPGLVTKDFANQALQLYLSRPLSRTEYLLGKISVLAVLLSCITWIPGLLLFGLQAGMEGNGWGWDNLYIAGAIIISSLLWIAVMSLITLALSIWVRWRIAATGLIFAVFFVLPGFAHIMDVILRTDWGSVMDLSYVMHAVWGQLFRFDADSVRQWNMGGVPLWSAWASILTSCLLAVLLLNRRLKRSEE